MIKRNHIIKLAVAGILAGPLAAFAEEPLTLTSASPSTRETGTELGAAPDTDVAIQEEAQPEVVDIYAPRPGRKLRRMPMERTAGDTNVILAPSARPLEEGQVEISLDELAAWRLSLGVTDDFTLEANSMWGFSAGLGAKYSLLRADNRAVSVVGGIGALTINKHINWTHVGVVYSRDFPRGAVHLGGWGLLVNDNTPRSYLIPQITAGAEVRLARRVTALFEGGLGSDVLHGEEGMQNNTGFINVGLRVTLKQVYVTGGLVMPTTEEFIESRALAVPFLRIGGTF